MKLMHSLLLSLVWSTVAAGGIDEPRSDTAVNTIFQWADPRLPAREYPDLKGRTWAKEWLLDERQGLKNLNMFMIVKKPESQGGELQADPVTLPHYHPDREQFHIVIEGRAKALVNGKEVILRPGTVVYSPPGAIHNIFMRSLPMDDDALKILEINSPTGADVDHDVWIGDAGEFAQRIAREARPPVEVVPANAVE